MGQDASISLWEFPIGKVNLCEDEVKKNTGGFEMLLRSEKQELFRIIFELMNELTLINSMKIIFVFSQNRKPLFLFMFILRYC